MSTATYIGQVVAKNLLWKAVQVRVPQMKLDSYLKMYFTEHEDHWSADPQQKCKQGDVVRIKSLSVPQSDVVHHEVREVVFPMGRIVDPITGRLCKGPKFHEQELERMSQDTSTNAPQSSAL